MSCKNLENTGALVTCTPWILDMILITSLSHGLRKQNLLFRVKSLSSYFPGARKFAAASTCMKMKWTIQKPIHNRKSICWVLAIYSHVRVPSYSLRHLGCAPDIG